MSTATAPLAWFLPNILRTAWAEATVIALALVFGLVRIVTGIPRVSRKEFEQESNHCQSMTHMQTQIKDL